MRYLKSINEYKYNSESYYTELNFQEYRKHLPKVKFGKRDWEPFTDLELADIFKLDKKMEQNYPAMVSFKLRMGFLFYSYVPIYIRKGLDEWFYVKIYYNFKDRYFKCDQFSAVKELLNNIKRNRI